jgi:lipopolysaccharide export system protein LptA
MIARGHVALTTEGRRGIGEQLIYTSRSGEYVLTGTSAIPPHITDAAHGSISGEAIHFFSHDDSVTVEGGRSGTHTETRTPR